MALSDKVKGPLKAVKKGPLWKGPEGDGPNGGVTQSFVSRFLVCRERFRLHAIEGLVPSAGWDHRMGYGNMWHVCEEAWAGHDAVASNGQAAKALADNFWKARLQDHAAEQCKLFPMDRRKIEHWWNVCRVQFPIYLDHWAKHPEPGERTQLLQERAFDVPYKLPSGRMVRLRGKWDGVCLKDDGVWLDEHKTKGDVDEARIMRQLSFDLQAMLYLTALKVASSSELARKGWSNEVHGRGLTDVNLHGHPITGVRYNVVRRPLSGGKGTIVQHKATKNKRAETDEEFYSRLGQYIKDDPGHFFMRFDYLVSDKDVERFRRECLDPILEQMCDWYDSISENPFGPWMTSKYTARGGPFPEQVPNKLHWRHPYGVWNSLNEGGFGDVDAFMEDGSLAGLRRTDELFPELKK